MRRRDGQRQKVYDAERAYWATLAPDAWERGTFRDEKELAECVARICKAQNRMRPRIHWRARGAGAAANAVELSWGPRCERWVVMHELAHSFAGGGEGHRRRWRMTYLALVEQISGRAHRLGLQAEMTARGVATRRPAPRRVLAPDVKAAAVERLRAYHAARRETRAAALEAVELVRHDERPSFWWRCDGCGSQHSSARDPAWYPADEPDLLVCSRECVVRARDRRKREERRLDREDRRTQS